MTYNVFGGTLNLAQSNQSQYAATVAFASSFFSRNILIESLHFNFD